MCGGPLLRLCWGGGGGNVTFLGIDGFPALLLVSMWYSGPLWIWGDVSCHDILVCVRGGCWRRPLEHASLNAQSVQESQCVRM